MTTNLTQPISKRLFIAILIITFGAEADLYLTRYSSLASTLYDAIMVASLFIGWRISRRLDKQEVIPKTKRQISLQITGGFLIFFIGSSLINIYSSQVFQDFSNDYDQYVAGYTNTSTNPSTNIDVSAPSSPTWSFFDKIDSVGADLYSDSLAGLEEVWRLAYMMLILMVCKKVFSRRWGSGSRDIFVMLALFLTSIVFGIDHTLDTEQPWSIKIGAIVTFANMGFLLGFILLWTRNLWVTVIVHAVYDMTATISWYYFDYAVEAFALVVLIIHVILFTIERMKKKHQYPLESGQIAE
jgi:membrane protease YdiL (CAAX protease family)